MERQRRGTGVDEPRPEREARPRAVLDAAPHLHGERHRDRIRDRVGDPAREIGILEQVRAGARLRHLSDGAAEVHVDDVCARGLHEPCRLGHRPRLGAEDLDRQRVLVRGDPEVAERPLVAVLDARAGDHLGADESGPVPPTLAAKCLHADPCHGREHDASRDLDVANPPGLGQLPMHKRRIVPGRC